MATTEAWTCPICRDARRDIASVIPCSHQFCVGCIQRWARLRDSCPLCRTAMRTMKVSVWGGEHYVECVISPPAVPVPADFQPSTATRPNGTVARAPSPLPQPSQQTASESEVRARLGGLLPQEWAALFRERRSILNPVLPSLHQKLSAIHGIHWWQVLSAESLFLCCLCWLGPDRAVMLQCTEPSLGPMAAPLTDWLVQTIISRCGREARRLHGLEDEEDSHAATSPQRTLTPSTTPSGSSAGPDVEELPGTSSELLHGSTDELPAAPSSGEQEQPQEESGQEAAGPSAQSGSHSCFAPGQSRKRCSVRPRRPKKRRAGSAQGAPQPCKRLRPWRR
ncbi:uncharacterized protein LOC116226361 [Phasianus colchicus]|uniref:uncharacterized protein LOC116226361 n=1 Tax=Phasianus colchicus TaxID=9054 RepID=UPI00129E1A4C|nr:uncharacterized protein LOC116226361 [Phasianus colchicus]